MGCSPEAYDRHLGYVSALGSDVVDLLDPRRGERVLDLGCGTGELAEVIARRGATVVGLDADPNMVRRARAKYPHLTFLVARAEAFRTGAPFDAVFSNAALHWMKPPEPVLVAIRAALRPGGRFVAEFGARGNVQTVLGALERALAEHGVAASGRNPWYFPTAGEYAALLSESGLRVLVATEFDRPTHLPEGERGLGHWLDGFAGSYLADLDPGLRRQIVARVHGLCRPDLFRDGSWCLDYRRLRVAAVRVP